MAIAYKSVGSVTYASANTCVIPKPAGLAAGDLMIAIIHQKNVNTATCALTGWTEIDTIDLNASSGDYAWTLWKIASSDDASATDFTFSLNRTAYVAGSIIRIDGHNSTSPINAHNYGEDENWDPNHSIAMSVTPSVSNCLLIMATFNSLNTTISDYAIATDNPSWTESYDIGSAGAGRSFSAAYASRPETSATGNSSFKHASGDGYNDYVGGTLLAVAPAVSGPANLKTYNTNVKANIKTINTNAIANVKTLNTNA